MIAYGATRVAPTRVGEGPVSTHCSPSRRRPRMAASEREGDGAATSLNVGFPIENPTYVVASGGRSWSQAPTAGLRSLTGPCWRVRHRQPCAETCRSPIMGRTSQTDQERAFRVAGSNARPCPHCLEARLVPVHKRTFFVGAEERGVGRLSARLAAFAFK
jgi:hypothetical protein